MLQCRHAPIKSTGRRAVNKCRLPFPGLAARSLKIQGRAGVLCPSMMDVGIGLWCCTREIVMACVAGKADQSVNLLQVPHALWCGRGQDNCADLCQAPEGQKVGVLVPACVLEEDACWNRLLCCVGVYIRMWISALVYVPVYECKLVL